MLFPTSLDASDGIRYPDLMIRSAKPGVRPRRPALSADAEGVPPGMDDLDFLRSEWQALTPAQRLRRAWRLRARLRDPQAIHDAKIFPRV